MDLLSADVGHGAGTGSMDLDYRLEMRGSTPDQLAASATGDGMFSWRNGVLENTPAPTEVSFALWSGRFVLQNQHIALRNTRMNSSSGIQQVSGEIAFGKPWELTFSNADYGDVAASGRLAAPVISKQSSGIAEARR
jgi:hypothetical protein